MTNVTPIRPDSTARLIEQLQRVADNTDHAPRSSGGGGSTLEARVAKLEALAEKTGERLGAIDVRLERIETKVDQLATKEALALTRADLHKTINDQTWKIITWMTGISTGLVAATFFVAKFVK